MQAKKGNGSKRMSAPKVKLRDQLPLSSSRGDRFRATGSAGLTGGSHALSRTGRQLAALAESAPSTSGPGGAGRKLASLDEDEGELDASTADAAEAGTNAAAEIAPQPDAEGVAAEATSGTDDRVAAESVAAEGMAAEVVSGADVEVAAEGMAAEVVSGTDVEVAAEGVAAEGMAAEVGTNMDGAAERAGEAGVSAAVVALEAEDTGAIVDAVPQTEAAYDTPTEAEGSGAVEGVEKDVEVREVEVAREVKGGAKVEVAAEVEGAAEVEEPTEMEGEGGAPSAARVGEERSAVERAAVERATEGAAVVGTTDTAEKATAVQEWVTGMLEAAVGGGVAEGAVEMATAENGEEGTATDAEEQ